MNIPPRPLYSMKRKRLPSYAVRRTRRRLRGLKKRLLPELKSHNTAGLAANIVDINGTPTVYSLASIAQGDTSTTRDGNVIVPTKIKMRITATLAQNASHSGTWVRLIVLMDKRTCSATPPTWSNVIATPTNINSFIARDLERGRWKILYDKKKYLSNNAMSADSVPLTTYWSPPNGHISFDVSVPLKRLPNKVFYGSASAPAIGNGLYWMIASENAFSTDPKMDYYTRTYFRDP